MPRNQLKNFPSAVRLRGLAHFCAACHVPVQPALEPPDSEPALLRGGAPPSPAAPAVTDPAPGSPLESVPGSGPADREYHALEPTVATLAR